MGDHWPCRGLRATRETDAASASNKTERISEVKVQELVLADGVPALVDGYMMVPIQPAGVGHAFNPASCAVLPSSWSEVPWSFGTSAASLTRRPLDLCSKECSSSLRVMGQGTARDLPITDAHIHLDEVLRTRQAHERHSDKGVST